MSKPKITDFYRIALSLTGRLSIIENKKDSYIVKVSVSGICFEAYYCFSPKGVRYVGNNWN